MFVVATRGKATESMSLKAFLVEDSPLIRESLIAVLTELAPVEVVGTAQDEATSVRWLRNPLNVCDLVIVDLFLTRGSGLGVLRVVDGARRPLVVLSNYLSPATREKCIELGASAMFDKSNEIDSLLAYCNRLAQTAALRGAPAARP